MSLALRRSMPAAALLLGLLGVAQPPEAHGAWARAFRLAGPTAVDITAPRLAIAASGVVAMTYSRSDEDSPAGSQAYLVLRSPQGQPGRPRAVAGAQEVLDLAYSRSTLELLTGGASRGQVCCSYASAVSLSGGRFGRPRTVVDRLTGFTLGRIIALGAGRLLAAVATERGVWATQSAGGDRFGQTRRLSSRQRAPWTLSAAILPTARTFIGWTGASPQPGGSGPRELMLATGSASSVPQSSRSVFVVPDGHQLDELALAPGSSVATAAWTESWFAADGSYRSQAVVADLGGRPHPRPFPQPGLIASSTTVSGDGSGEDVVAWKACDRAASCSVWALLRPAGGRFESPTRLGAIDASQAPVTALGGGGRAVVGWVDRGRIQAADRRPLDARFSPSQTVLTSSLSHDLTLAVTPDGSVLAAWIQGTFQPSVVGDYYR